MAEPRRCSGPQGPVWFDATTKTWFSTARVWSQRSKWVDLAAIHEIRLGIDHLADRRPDAYAPPLPAAAVLGFAR